MESFWIAFIGVIGTLAGVTITSVMGLLTAKINAKVKSEKDKTIEKAENDIFTMLLAIYPVLENPNKVKQILDLEDTKIYRCRKLFGNILRYIITHQKNLKKKRIKSLKRSFRKYIITQKLTAEQINLTL